MAWIALKEDVKGFGGCQGYLPEGKRIEKESIYGGKKNKGRNGRGGKKINHRSGMYRVTISVRRRGSR
jgi:hypothetical protein